MIKNTEVIDNKAIVTYEFSESDKQVLNHFKDYRYMEFRKGGIDIVDNLMEFGFVESDDDAWHFTIVLTDLGKSVINAMNFNKNED